MTDNAAVTTFARHAGGYDDPRRRLVPPFEAFYGTAVDALGLAADEVVMIGDDIRVDVGGAQRAGLSGVLVRTGKFSPADLDGDVVPDEVLDSVADLPRWWTGR